MLLTFGRSAFALPAISGVSLAAGSAVGSATVSGVATAYKNGIGNPVAAASCSAVALRTVAPSSAVITRAVVAGGSKKLAAAFGGAVGPAYAVATPACVLSAGGQSFGAAPAAAVAVKTAKPAYAGGVRAAALVVGASGEVLASATAITAQARAWVWGTTFQVGRSDPVVGDSACSGAATRTQQARGATGDAVVLIAVARKDAAAFGAATNNVVAIGAARFKRSGVGYQDGFGDAVCNALTPTGVVSVTPTALIIARAVPIAAAEVAFRAIAVSVCEALVVSGEANLIPVMGVSGASLGCSVGGSAMVSAIVSNAVGQCSVAALPAGATVRSVAGGGVALSVAADAALAEVMRPVAGWTLCTVSGTGYVFRTARVTGVVSIGAALGDAGVLINPLSAATYVIEVDVPDNLIEALVPDNLVTVDAFDNLVEAA